jgi:hypothetical protein
MRFLTARHLALIALSPALLLCFVIPGCSNESEGQRCGDDVALNDADCGDGLVCVVSGQLLNSNGADRCCRSDKIVTDSRCLPATNAPANSGGTGGTDNGGGGTAAGGGIGATTGGAADAAGASGAGT